MPDSTLLNLGPASWVLLAVLLLGAAAVWRFALSGGFRHVFAAGIRALLQLALVALIISRVSGNPLLALLLVAVMFAVATWTSGRRVAQKGRWWMAALPIAAGVLPTGLLMFASGVLPADALALIAVLGQQIGGAMATTTVAGRRIEAELSTRRGEVEAGAALGLTWPQARMLIAGPVAGEAVLPSIDQARTAGTVTLPGAFVGLILGGADPFSAALVQLLVLISLLLVNTVAAWTTLQLSARAGWRPLPR
ncbi:ABC transporter permease [Arthrobacter sp. Marseille-P9274]|uniref:ABC transporter permease n=1 Tax=Arthrobacter sp. Marseille-P9274 TaxID=2866572 RepID=UPI0021C9FEF6|nr:ABC transporter permease [Arthrobacter sp. Marseille-P9274]